MAIHREDGVKVVSVGELLNETLIIPSYQRPYRWKPATALQLLDDILNAPNQAEDERVSDRQPSPYVLGAVILHEDEEAGQTHVVDGQQRLLTLTMLLALLDPAADLAAAQRAGEGEDPQAPVVLVRTELARQITHLKDRTNIADYIGNHCQLIRVATNDPDEAFRVFDSQNYRGKPLLPHDLLKAHHLREMRGDSDAMREALVEAWQEVPDNDLAQLFSTYLWRVKKWSRGQPAPAFGTEYVDAFKGLTSRSADSPASRYHLAAQAAVPLLAAWKTPSLAADREMGRTRFQIDAPGVAGRAFFEMVTFMLGELRQLRREGVEKRWEVFTFTDEDLREKGWQTRYRYVSELYLAALLYCTNKFGHADNETRQRLFRWAYGLRTRFLRLQYSSVDNHASGSESAFVLLRHADRAEELRRLNVQVSGNANFPSHEADLLSVLTGPDARHDGDTT